MTVSRAADHTADDRQRASAWATRLLETAPCGSYSDRVNLYVAACLMAAGVRPCEFGDPDLELALKHGGAALTVDQLQAVADRLDALPEDLLAAVSR